MVWVAGVCGLWFVVVYCWVSIVACFGVFFMGFGVLNYFGFVSAGFGVWFDCGCRPWCWVCLMEMCLTGGCLICQYVDLVFCGGCLLMAYDVFIFILWWFCVLFLRYYFGFIGGLGRVFAITYVIVWVVTCFAFVDWLEISFCLRVWFILLVIGVLGLFGLWFSCCLGWDFTACVVDVVCVGYG